VAEIFKEVEPLAGKRHVAVTQHRTRKEWAMQIEKMLDERYSSATKVRLVIDNLETHTVASLYEKFEPEEIRRLEEQLDIHHTPKHVRWLNVAEIELSVLKGPRLDRRIPAMASMQTEIVAWERERKNSAREKLQAAHQKNCILL
jgi:hypothetical protein